MKDLKERVKSLERELRFDFGEPELGIPALDPIPSYELAKQRWYWEIEEIERYAKQK